MNRIRLALAAGPVIIALVLLAQLLVIATQPGDAAARRLDLTLRQAASLAPRIVSLSAAVLRDDTLTDPGAVLGELGAALDRRLDLANEAFAVLHPKAAGPMAQVRLMAVQAFNSIDQDLDARPAVAELRTQFAAVDATSAVFHARREAVAGAYRRWKDLDSTVDNASRALVGDLRARGADAAADRIFNSAAQLRERVTGGMALRLTDADALVADLAGAVHLATDDEQARFDGLLSAMRGLRPARATLEDTQASLADNPLPRMLPELREQVAADLRIRLATIGDARTILNIYTALLLLVLVYFGLRLRSSHAELNRSHEQLELRVVERTADLLQANEDLKESQVQLVQAEKMSSLGQLVAGVMHEINTPLMYVQSNVETCEESIAGLADEFRPALDLVTSLREGRTDQETLRAHLVQMRKEINPDEIAQSVQEVNQLTADTMEGLEQISELVQSLKDFSRIDRADEDWFDVREGLERTLTITRNLVKYGVEVVKDFEDVPKIRCAPSRLNQVFINMVTNAVQAMDGKGRLELTTRSLGDSVQVCISDTGCGIPQDLLGKVMDPFFTTKPVGEGTGLGLSIVRQIIDEHGGQLEIDSVVDIGTTMVITLPVTREAAAAGEVPADQQGMATA